MKTHTPGPWLVNFEQNKFDSRRSKVQVVDGSSASLNNGGLPLVLANVNAMPFNDESVPLANAHLIASAPEMLEALENLRNSIRHTPTCRAPQAFPCSCDADKLWQMSGAVIAKAKGNL